MAAHGSDRRREPRFPNSGSVEIAFEDPELAIVAAELQDSSAHGCRILHDSKGLLAGTEIQLRHNGTVSRARVVWTHLLEGRRVSGCLLL